MKTPGKRNSTVSELVGVAIVVVALLGVATCSIYTGNTRATVNDVHRIVEERCR